MKWYSILICLTILCSNLYSQVDSFSKEIHLSLQDYLEMKLKIRALELTMGTYAPLDMGKVGFPVSIDLNSMGKIRFKIEGKVDTLLNQTTQKEIITESIQIVIAGINDVLLSCPNYDSGKGIDIVGFWYYPNSFFPCAGWRDNKFEWIKYKTGINVDPYETW
jgi:hypothetical protein